MIPPTRFIGLDIHKEYLVASGVDQNQNQVFGPVKVTWGRFENWIQKNLDQFDAVALEMTTNSWRVYDTLEPHVNSVTIVHPPDVALIVKAQVKTDKRAALTLAKLHAAGLLPAIWVPDQRTRDIRALVSQRQKMVRLSTQAKNRLHAALHRHHFGIPEDGGLFAPENRAWWLELPVSKLEQTRIVADLDTLSFAIRQIAHLETAMEELGAEDESVPLLVQIPGVGLLTAVTILGAIGTIYRFPEPRKLVGYAGLGASVHDSGKFHATGRITKRGRRDLRTAMVGAANRAVQHHPHWKAELERLEPHLGRSKAIVAIARKLLVVVWHVLTKQAVDKHADPQTVARAFFNHAYHHIGAQNMPEGIAVKDYVRQQMDRLGIGKDLTYVKWGSKRLKLPPSHLQ